MLSYANKKNRDIGRMDKTDQRADHVSYRVTLGDDEAVKRADGPESSIEVACLGDGVCSYEGLYKG